MARRAQLGTLSETIKPGKICCKQKIESMQLQRCRFEQTEIRAAPGNLRGYFCSSSGSNSGLGSCSVDSCSVDSCSVDSCSVDSCSGFSSSSGFASGFGSGLLKPKSASSPSDAMPLPATEE